MSTAPDAAWRHYRFGPLVTGKGEERFLDRLFRSLCERFAESGHGSCTFSILAKIEQLTPRTSVKRTMTRPGKTGVLPQRDEAAAIKARTFLQKGGDFVVLVDDLEGSRRAEAAAVYARYREAFDRILSEPMRCRVSVHFLVNMLEAYYFAHAQSINAVMGTDWSDHDGDVEDIRHPKGDLKSRLSTFDEVEHGEQILPLLDVPHVLSRTETCASLRTLFGWCWRALGMPPGEFYQLANGRCFDVTQPQIDRLPSIAG